MIEIAKPEFSLQLRLALRLSEVKYRTKNLNP